jgi:predicted DNA-binding protein
MKRTTSVNVRMTDQLREELQRLADANKRTLSDYVRIVLEEHAEGQRGRSSEPARDRRSR